MFAGEQATFVGFINSVVHVIMYFYYMVAAMGPKYQKYIWWKKYMTWIQLVSLPMTIVWPSTYTFFVEFTSNFPRACVRYNHPISGILRLPNVDTSYSSYKYFVHRFYVTPLKIHDANLKLPSFMEIEGSLTVTKVNCSRTSIFRIFNKPNRRNQIMRLLNKYHCWTFSHKLFQCVNL
jgi:hypothetical protein